jgi:hypothetical protein
MKLNKSYIVWALICALFLVFIGALSYMLPLMSDDYLSLNLGFIETLGTALYVFIYHSPKIGVFIGAALIFIGKWFFVFINPLIQLALVSGAFYFIYLRLPDFKSFKDIYSFILIMLLCVFAAPVAMSTIFWINGAANYSWVFLFFILYICFLRALQAGRPLFKDSLGSCFLLFPLGLALGLSNENNAPMAFIIGCVFLAFNIYQKKKLPKWFYVCLAGIASGICYLMFSPALSTRLADYRGFTGGFTVWQNILFNKLTLPYVLQRNLYLPVINIALMLLCFYKGKGKIIKYESFVLGALCYIAGFGLGFAMFLAPAWLMGTRVFYSAFFFNIICFVLLLTCLNGLFNFNFLKYGALLTVFFVVYASPYFIMPYWQLHKQDKRRQAV